MFLDGYRLIDMCWLGPGPFVAQLLGDLGFDVIRVSEVAKGAGRRGGKDIGTLLSTHNSDQLGAFLLGMRNTRSIAVPTASGSSGAWWRKRMPCKRVFDRASSTGWASPTTTCGR
ncbi:MAG: CoA transferase [Deltaproteobacteria bacterium]|nr:CoA transferase [Deltaproteobacteria bacterium]